MKAPSEKHLEDWILRHSDFMAFNVDGTAYRHSHLHIIRQQMLPSGIADVISIQGENSITVFELKKDAIKSDALAQLCRYMNDVRHIGKHALEALRDPYDPFLLMPDPAVRGVLIGSDLSDQHLIAACELCRIDVWTYSYNPAADEDETYRFELHTQPRRVPERNYESYADGELGTAFKLVYEKRYNAFIENPAVFHTLQNMDSIAPYITYKMSNNDQAREYEHNGRNFYQPYYDIEREAEQTAEESVGGA